MKQPLGIRVDSPLRVWLFVFLVTLFATISSLILVALVLWLSGFGTPPTTYLIAGVVPLFVVPPVTYVLAQIAYKLTCMQEELLRLANTDELTGLYNRRAFFEQGNALISAAMVPGVSVGLLLIDADNFKQVNDSFGHAAGDDALRYLAQTIVASAAPNDVVARFGGDEFAVLRFNATHLEMDKLAKVLRTELRQNCFNYCNTPLTLAISTGVADSKSYHTFDSLLLATDIALYADKAKRCHPELLDHSNGLHSLPSVSLVEPVT